MHKMHTNNTKGAAIFGLYSMAVVLTVAIFLPSTEVRTYVDMGKPRLVLEYRVLGITFWKTTESLEWSSLVSGQNIPELRLIRQRHAIYKNPLNRGGPYIVDMNRAYKWASDHAISSSEVETMMQSLWDDYVRRRDGYIVIEDDRVILYSKNGIVDYQISNPMIP